jgi:hypothetical protein
MMPEKITMQSVIAVAPEQVSCDLAGEAAILNLKTGVYYGLNPVGSRVWELVQQPRSVGEVRDVLLQEYDVDAAQCEADLMKLLQDLSDNKLIEVKETSEAAS